MGFRNVAGDFLSGLAVFALGLVLMFMGIYIIIRGAFELQGLYFQASASVGVTMFLAGGVVALYQARVHTVGKIEREIEKLSKEIKAIRQMIESLTSTK